MTEHDDLLAAYDAQVRPAESADLPNGVVAEQDGPIVSVVGHHRGFIPSPPDLDIDLPLLDELIERARARFSARHEAVEWKTWSHDPQPGLADRLLAAGFVAEEPETVLVAEAAALTATPMPAPDGVAIRRTASAQDLRDVAALNEEVWGAPMGWLHEDLLLRAADGPDHVDVFVAALDGRIVAAGWLATNPGTDFAGLWGGATLGEFRHRGIYRALVLHRARLAVDLGFRYLQVDASSDSRPVLERMGFTAITTTTPYVWSPAADGPSRP
jgi:ribosomal protein S18 acetylase RimI-like enzyme